MSVRIGRYEIEDGVNCMIMVLLAYNESRDWFTNTVWSNCTAYEGQYIPYIRSRNFGFASEASIHNICRIS